MTRPPKYNKSLKEKDIKMKKDGYKIKEIAEELNINCNYISSILNPKSHLKASTKYYQKNRDKIIEQMRTYKNPARHTKWLIWSIEHNGWWCSNWRGYTSNRDRAGIYSYEEACRIVDGGNIHKKDVPNEAMIKLEDEKDSSKKKVKAED